MRGGSAGISFLKPFFSFEKTFFKVSAQNFHHHFKWSHWLRKFPVVFQPIIMQNYDVYFTLVLNLLHWCYTWTACSQSESCSFFTYINYYLKKNRQLKCVKLPQKLFVVPQELVYHLSFLAVWNQSDGDSEFSSFHCEYWSQY